VLYEDLKPQQERATVVSVNRHGLEALDKYWKDAWLAVKRRMKVGSSVASLTI
jgi:hypothetical protein